MPTDLDFVLYFNIAFISVLALGMLFGFLRGFKKSIWHFFVTLIFYAVFFLTLNTVVNLLWGMNMPFLGGLLGNVMPSLSSATSFEEAVSLLLQDFLGVGFEDSLTTNFSDLVTSVGVFVLKIVYTILYFTVIQIIYRLIFWILRMIIFPSKKKTDKYKSKNRGLGAVFGLLTGAISLYVTLIIFGGLISISDSLLQVIPEPEAQPVAQVEMYNGFPNPNDTIISSEPVIQIGLDDPQLLASIELLNNMVDAYNNNIVVTTQNAITMPSAYTGEEMPMNLYLFDSVLSMDYQEEQIAIREELAVFARLAGELLESDYFDTGVLSDITGTDISNLFNGLSESNLITTLLPIAVEVGTYYVETDLTIPVDDLYTIEWDDELATLGQIAATAFDLVNAAGILTEGTDLYTVSLEAEDVESLFDSLGQSELITLAAYVAVEPLLEQVGGTVAQIITIPDGVNWANEFAALGDLANEILSTDITLGEISGGDPTVLLGYLSEIDFTVIQNSEIISTAIINILSGQTDINVSFLAVPTDIDWDTELENILLAINILAQQVGDLDFSDFENLSFETIAKFDLTAINAIFESEILVATITKYLRELDLGDEFSIIIPDSALDDERLYLLKTELQNIVSAADVIVKNMQCDDGDDACAELGFDITKMLALEDDDIDTLLLPEILAATVGNLLLDLGSDVLTIPGEALTEITVDLIAQDVVSRDEIKFAFKAISSLGITDIDDIEVDASILNVLAYDRYYFDNDENILDLDDVIVYTKELTGDYTDSDDNVYTINSVTGDLEDDLSEVVVSNTYLYDTKALAEAADLELDTDKSDNLTGSKILMATLTKYLIDFAEPTDGSEAMIVVPYFSELSTPIRILDTVDGTTERIHEDEIEYILRAILALNITDFENFELDLDNILANVSTLLDSSILHATVSKQLMDLGDPIVVPEKLLSGGDLLVTVGIAEEENTYIAKSELQAAFDALSALGITDINDVNIDIGILDNLELDETALDTRLAQSTKDDLFGSTIINATLSKFLIDFAEPTDGSESLIVVPYINELNQTVRTEAADGTQYIVEDELIYILEAILALGLTDFDAFETLDLETDLIPNLEQLLDSAILHATVSKQLIDLVGGEDSFIKVPQNRLNGDPLRFVKGDPLLEEDTEFIARQELIDTFDSLIVLGVTDIANVDIDVSILENLAMDRYYLDSNDNIVNLDDEIIYTYIGGNYLDGESNQYTINGVTGDLENALSEVVIESAYLYDTKIEAEDGDLVLSDLKKDDLLGSTIINATLSYFMIDFAEPTDGSDPLIVVPFIDEDDAIIRTTEADGTEFISVDELTNILKAILALNISDFNNFETLNLETQIIPHLNTLLDSAILHATISKQLIDLVGGEDSFIKVPQNRLNGDPLRFIKGDPLLEEDTEFIARQELIDTFDSLIVLGVTDIANVDIDVSILENLAMDRYYLDSNDNIVNLDDEIIYTYIGGNYLDGESNQYTINGVTGDLENALSEVVIESAYLYDTKIEAEDGDLVLSDLKKDDLLGSTIINATLSYFMIDFAEPTDGSDPLIVVPFIDEDDAIIRTTEADGTEFISVDELTNILKAILALNISDFNNVETLNLETQIIPNLTTLLDSAIMHATISKQLLDQVGGEGSVVIVPVNRLNGDPLKFIKGDPLLEEDTEFIASAELIDTFDALIALGITDIVNGLDIDVNILTNLAEDPEAETLVLDQDKKDDLFGSTIINATLSKFILDEAEKENAFIVVPTEDQALATVRFTDLEDNTEFIHQDELTNLVEAILALNLTNFDAVEDFSLDTIIENKTVLLDSAILHASISKQLIDLGSDLVTIPEYFEDNNELQLTRGTAILIHRTELEATFDALKVLNLDLGNVSMSIAILNELAFEVYYKDVNDNLVNLDDEIIYTWNNMGFYTDVDENIFTINVGTGDLENVLTEVQVYSRHLFDTKLEAEAADKELDTDNKSPLLFNSTIIKATISKFIIDQSVSDDPLEDPFLIVPYFDEDGGALRNTTIDLVDILVQQELEDLLGAVLALGLTDFNVDTLSFDTIIAKKSTLLASSILQATISDQIINLGTGVIEVPYKDETNLIDIVKTPGDSLEETETTYISYDELNKLLDSMEILELGNIEEFNGNTIDLNDLSGQEAIFVDSAIIQATISKQVINMVSDPDPTATTSVVIPYKTDIGDIDLRMTVGIVGHETEMIKKTELVDLIEGFLLLGFGNVDELGNDISLSDLADNATGIFESYIIQATVSGQVLALADPVIIPFLEDDNLTRVRTEVGALDDYVSKTELENLVEALVVFNEGSGEDDLTNFDGLSSLNIFFDPIKRGTILESSIMQATISSQIMGYDQIVVPKYSDDNTEEISFSVGLLTEEKDYITVNEIDRLFESLEILGFGNIDELGGDIDLGDVFESNNPGGYDQAQDDLLASRIMQATISKQINEVAALRIPTENQDDVAIKVTNLTSDFFVYVSEIKNLFNALDVLGVSNIGTYDGSVSISSLFSNPLDPTDTTYLDNRTTMLSSAIIHATMTDQIDNMDTINDTINIPTLDINDGEIKYLSTNHGDYFIVREEIKNLLTALEVFGFTGGAEGDIGDFSGVDDFSVLGDSNNQTTILNSAIMHATLSDKLLGVDDNVLIVPMHTEASETSADLIRITKSGTEFIVKDEIKHILYALNDMQVLNFEATTIDSSKFFEDPDTYLLSSSIQATISKKIIDINTNPLDPMLIFPDEDIRRDPDEVIYIEHTDVDYIELVELKALLASLDALTLTNFSSVTIDATSILGQTHENYLIIFGSAIMQATVSDRIIENAKDEDTVTTAGQLIIPKAKKETIEVEAVPVKWIEHDELIYLVEALDIMGVDFSGSVDGDIFSGKEAGDIDDVLLSATMHITFNYMIQDNTSIEAPNLALVGGNTSGSIYGITNVVTALEIRKFIVAVNQIGGDIGAEVTFAAISTLNKSQRDIAIDSMIIRLKITPNLEDYMTLILLDPYDVSDYEVGSSPQFVIYLSAQDTLDTIAGD